MNMYTYNYIHATIYWLSHPYSKVLCPIQLQYWKVIQNDILSEYLSTPVKVKNNAIFIAPDWFIMQIGNEIEDVIGFCSAHICFLFDRSTSDSLKDHIISLYNLKHPTE